MYNLSLNGMTLSVDFAKGEIASILIDGKERSKSGSPLFAVRLRDLLGCEHRTDAKAARKITENEGTAIYEDFGEGLEKLSVKVMLTEENKDAAWRINVDPGSDGFYVEWVDFPLVKLPKLKCNNKDGDGGSVLFPYNEGVMVSDMNKRENSWFTYNEPEYPSHGSYGMFPYMVCSQLLAYIWDDAGLYIGVHDPDRACKGINFFGDESGTTMQIRLFTGCEIGEVYKMAYPIIMARTDERWESSAEKYRNWFETCLPPRMKKVLENPSLPSWYKDEPLIVSYPVRGVHDMDEMKPNKLYPYTNALPIIDEIKKATDAKIMALLMHWEGSAPWAPPYVWPPYGGEENFKEFMNTLHENGDLLGVYCSGFGYTIQSNLIAEYNNEKEIERRNLKSCMCQGPDLKVHISRICTGQRSGYDICAATDLGKEVLYEAYSPLFTSGVDYAQILDQNHGGSQYFCYARDHGHPPTPGAWMTKNMQKMLTTWNESAPHMLFGCESASAEPYAGNLQFSDNRYEVNYQIGECVPLYAYIYHEYLRNFMGNQVASPFSVKEDTIRYRLAYSFAAGDCMTLVINPDGDLLTCWGTRDFSNPPNKEKTLTLIKNLTKFYREEAMPYLYAGKMITPMKLECDTVTYHHEFFPHTSTLPVILTTAWQANDGTRAQILVNPEDKDITCKVGGQEYTVPALSASIIKMN